MDTGKEKRIGVAGHVTMSKHSDSYWQCGKSPEVDARLVAG